MKNNYTLPDARRDLEKLGFEFTHKCIIDGTRRSGFREAEKIKTGKDHFIPKFRMVYISERATNRRTNPKSGIRFLVGSHLHGEMRGYRCRNWNETKLNYVSGLGQTLKEAVENFKRDFADKVK